MAKVDAFHTDTDSPNYHPRERYVYHDQSRCGYGQRVKMEGNAIAGIGKEPQGNARELCDNCADSAFRVL